MNCMYVCIYIYIHVMAHTHILQTYTCTVFHLASGLKIFCDFPGAARGRMDFARCQVDAGDARGSVESSPLTGCLWVATIHGET